MHELLLLFIIIKRKYYQKGLFIDIPCRSWLGFDLYSIYLFIPLLCLPWFGLVSLVSVSCRIQNCWCVELHEVGFLCKLQNDTK